MHLNETPRRNAYDIHFPNTFEVNAHHGHILSTST